MPTTPLGVWSPADSDDWDLTVDLAAMALSIDSAISTSSTNSLANTWYGTGTIAQRDALLPPVRKTNFVWRDSATGLTFVYNGTAWVNTNEVINIARIAPVTTGTQSITTGTSTDLTGMSVTFTLTAQSIVRFNVQVNTYGADTGHVVALAVTNGTLVQSISRMANSAPSTAGTSNMQTWSPEFTVPAGTHTFKVQASRAAGATSAITINPTSSSPGLLSVDRIG